MLLRTCFSILMIAAVGDTIVHAAMALGAAALHRGALVAARAEIMRAESTLQQSIALHAVIPAPRATCVQSNAGGCTLLATTQIGIIVAASPVASLPPCPQADCTAYAQGNDVVAEGRVSATISTQITSIAGTVLASRSARVLFRTFAVPPYAALVGSLDGTTAAVVPNHVGDDGGSAPSNGSPGTLIDVFDRNANNGTLTPANVWLAGVQNAPLVSLPWEP